MGREGELWDDSVLINAFNHALSNYKIMHSQGGDISSAEEGKIISSREENISTPNGQIHEARCLEKDSNNNAASNATMDIGETGNISSIEENHHVELGAPEKDRPSLDGQNIEDEQTRFLNSQTSEDYNQLLSKYYELEDQRQKVLQQLNQFGYGGYQNSYATAGNYQNIGPTTSTSLEHQAYATQTSYPTMTCSCCPYGCQISVAPCTSLPACGLSAVCVDKTGNTTSNTEVKEKELETKIDHIIQGSGTDTDFSEVINAWYKAGFYTGKYLAEQKRQH